MAFALANELPASAQTAVSYTGPNNGNWNTPGNWSGGMVPINGGGNSYAVTIPASRTVLFDVPGAGNQISSLTVATTSEINFTPIAGGSLEVLGAASLGGVYWATGDKTFRTVGPGTTFNNSRFLTDAGGEIVVDTVSDQYLGTFQATTFIGTALGLPIFEAKGVDGVGTGSLLNLSSLTELTTTAANGNVGLELTIHAADKGTVDLRNVTTAGFVASQPTNRLKFFIEGGANGNGNIRLDNLQTANSVRFDVRVPGYTLPALTTAPRSDFIVSTGSSLTANGLPSLDAALIDVASGGTLTIASVGDLTTSVVTLAGSAQLTTAPLSDINGSRFLLSGGAAFSNVTDTAYAGTHTATTFIGTALGLPIFEAKGVDGVGTGSLLNLSSLTELTTTAANGNVGLELTIHAADKGTVDLRNVTTAGFVASQPTNRLKFFIEGGANGNGNIRLDNLQTANSVRFDVRVPGYTLPALTTAPRSDFIVSTGSSLTANGLPSLDAALIDVASGGTLTIASVGDLTTSVVTLAGSAQLTTAPLSDINGSRFLLSGGAAFSNVTDTAYAGTHTATTFIGTALGLPIFEAKGVDGVGTGSLLNLSSLTELTTTAANGNVGLELTIHAADKGTVDLRNVTTAGFVASQPTNRLKFFIEGGANGNGNIRLDNLQTANSVRFDVRVPGYTLPALTTAPRSDFIVSTGSSLTANGLPSLDAALIDVASGGTLTIASVGDLTTSVVTLAGSAQLTTAPLSDINGSRFLLSGGAAFSNVTDTAYAGTHTATTFIGTALGLPIFEAKGVDGVGTGSLLNLSSLTELTTTAANGNVGLELTIHAADKGTVDLRNVTTAGFVASQPTNRLKFFIEGGANGNGNIRLDNLQTANSVRFDVRAGGQVTVGDLDSMTRTEVLVSSASGALPAGEVEAKGDMRFDTTSTLVMQAGSVLRLGGGLSFTTQTEANFVTGQSIVEMQGAAERILEVGGEDLGVGGATGGNFGIGQLIIGTAGQPTTVVLLDGKDNGNGTGMTKLDDEVIYLFGEGGQDGLRINANSIAVLYGVDAYAFKSSSGQQIHLNSLFPIGVTQIEYDQGFLQLIDYIDGDYNGNGLVDAADYVIWRKTVGQSGPNLRADGNDDGMITQLDYDMWRANFGNRVLDVVPGSGAFPPVPEPGPAVLLVIAAVGFQLPRRHTRC